ncbi:putative cytokinetic ring protein SteA [Corynebacterium qintianiae]|uniref:putative cytokinetic ring protein SteA n=1 Tax=Corynebacterium qintianiae TaxID=2709392 RepID=UPI0013EB8110|nr:putative cytokinetic ring protein SteA [Corynebacterium qintianiae]
MWRMTVNSGETATTTVQGRIRDCTAQGKGLSKLGAGDIAVVDSPDMTRREADVLADAKPGAVVNLSRFTTGAIPNYGPHLLMDAGIPLVEGAGAEVRSVLRSGKKAAIGADGAIYVGKKLAGKGEYVDRAAVDASFAAAQQSLVDQMEAYFGNTIEFIHSESPLLIDGVGVPELGDAMAGQKVLVVSGFPGEGGLLRERLGNLRNFIREYSPVIIGVGGAADTLTDLGYDPDLIVGDPSDISAEALRGNARVILPADPDGHAVGLERIQDLGVGAMTFPAATNSPMDLAILLAAFHDAETIVAVGDAVDLDRIFANPEGASPAALLARLKAGRRLVDSTVIENLYRSTSGGGVAWAWAILGLLVALAAVILIVGLGGPGEFTENLVDTWNQIALRVQGWFN